MTKIFNWWREINGWDRIAIMTIPTAIILIIILCLNLNWSEYKTTEEDYLALEQVAEDIVESKNVFQPTSEKLLRYEIYVAETDGTIKIELFGTSESIVVYLTEDFQIETMYRRASHAITNLFFAILGLIGTAYVISVLFYLVFVGIKRVYLCFKK